MDANGRPWRRIPGVAEVGLLFHNGIGRAARMGHELGLFVVRVWIGRVILSPRTFGWVRPFATRSSTMNAHAAHSLANQFPCSQTRLDSGRSFCCVKPAWS